MADPTTSAEPVALRVLDRYGVVGGLLVLVLGAVFLVFTGILPTPLTTAATDSRVHYEAVTLQLGAVADEQTEQRRRIESLGSEMLARQGDANAKLAAAALATEEQTRLLRAICLNVASTASGREGCVR